MNVPKMVVLPVFQVVVTATTNPNGTVSYQMNGKEMGLVGSLHPLSSLALLSECVSTFVKQQAEQMARKTVVQMSATEN